jgi:hypothetical protein
MRKALVRQNSFIWKAVPQSCEILSRNAFLFLYIHRYSRGFDTLTPLLTISPPAGYLHASVDAVSFAFMAYQENRPDLITEATRRYLAAIQSLRKAVIHPRTVQDNVRTVSNQILQSVLLLDLYEKLNQYRHTTTPSVSGSWLTHISGALHMIRARRSSEFSDSITQQLANRINFSLTISCGAANSPIPEGSRTFQDALARHVRSPKSAFINLLSAIVDFRSKIKHATLSADAILLQAQELNTQLLRAENNIPDSWRPKKVYSDNPLAFNNHYDLYPDHYATQVFNAFRIMRLEMNAIIRNLSSSSLVAGEIATITHDICTSIPQFILQEANSENAVPLSPLQKLQCSGVLTHLYVAAQITIDTLTREWILQCLAYMTSNGLKMARDVSHILTSVPETNYWVVFAMLGSCGITA